MLAILWPNAVVVIAAMVCFAAIVIAWILQ